MWVFCKAGIFSINQYPKNRYNIRARAVKDLEELLKMPGVRHLVNLQILELPESDYQYRIEVSQEDLPLFLKGIGDSVDYPNFKDSLSPTHQKSRHGLYLNIGLAVERYFRKQSWGDRYDFC